MTEPKLLELCSLMEEFDSLRDETHILINSLRRELSKFCPGIQITTQGRSTLIVYPDGKSVSFATCRLWKDEFMLKDIFEQAVLSQRRRRTLL